MLEHFWHWLAEPYNQKLCFGFLAAFFLGLIAGYFTKLGKKRKLEAIQGDSAFFKGIQYILSNDRDHAIEEFTKSVQVNSNTVETYVALGNLYRSKGDIDRAIHIRQTIILRPNIDEQTKVRALIDLGLDYKNGGFINRALDSFMKVLEKRPSDLETLLAVEKIYEELKDWENAFLMRQKISKLIAGDHSNILAHHQTEIGKVFIAEGNLSKAKNAFQKALYTNEKCIDAYLHLGDLYFGNKEYKKAIGIWKKIVDISPRFTFLAYRRLEGAYSKMKNLKPVEDFLKESAQFTSDAFTHLALARYLYNSRDLDAAVNELNKALNLDPSFWEARKFIGEILLEQSRTEEALDAYRDLIPHLNFQYLEFQCSNCGFVPGDLMWQCPQCRTWDSIKLVDSAITEPSSSSQPSDSLSDSVPIDFEEDI